MKRYFWILMVIGLTIPSFFSLLRPGIHNIQDSMQYFRVYELDKCLSDGQIPCRWVPDMGYGYGYPLYIYYSPLPYYVGSILHSIGWQYIDSVKILFIGGFVISALAMYALLMAIFNNSVVGVVGSMVYIYAPVRAVQVYVRGSLGENLAMAIFPLLFLYVYKIYKNGGWRNQMGLALSLSCLLLTHNLMSLAFAPILVWWIIVQMGQEKVMDRTKDVVMALLWGVGLAAFYVVPIVFERGYVHLESMMGGYFDYRQHFVSLYQLFISNHWGYGSSYLGPGDDLSLSVGIGQWLIGLVAITLSIINYKKDKVKSKIVWMLGLISLVVIFLVHEKSSFIWSSISLLPSFQFPWRWLVISTFLMSLMAGYGMSYLNHRLKYLAAIIIIIMIWGISGSFFRPQKWSLVTDDQMLTGSEFVKQQTASIFDYLPKSAVLPPNYPAKVSPEIMAGQAVIKDYIKGSNWQVGKISVTSEKAIIRLPIFDFPGMVVKDNGRPIDFNHSDCSGQDYCFGQISFELKKGEHDIEVKLGKTWPRWWGDVISMVIAIFTIWILLFKKQK